MAWVRPKHPKPKPKADPVDTLVPLLSYITNRRVTSRPTSPIKNTPPPTPLSRDPILRSFQQAQECQIEESITDDDEAESEYQLQPPPSSHREKHSSQRRLRKEPSQPAVRVYERKPPPPPPPPPPRVVRQQPRVSSYERYRPAEPILRDVVAPRHKPYPTYSERAPSRAVSARWASATTPLDLR
ncbi:MAG: hypothetical protein Q9170_006978 [Blastenia crenularia]